jgi:hypothetical protein
MYVTVKNVTEKQAKTILKLCIDNNLKFDSRMIITPVDSEYPHYFWHFSKETISQCNIISGITTDIIISFTEFCNYIKGKGKEIKPPFKQEVKLSDNYNAIVTKEGIKVGCTTFTHEVIKQLYETCLKSQE